MSDTTPKTVQASAWLVCEYRVRKYGDGTLHLIRVTQKKPSCSPNEVAVKLQVELPVGLFTRPSITARVRLEGDAAPTEIDVATVAGIEAAIKAGGFDVRVTSDDSSRESP